MGPASTDVVVEEGGHDIAAGLVVDLERLRTGRHVEPPLELLGEIGGLRRAALEDRHPAARARLAPPAGLDLPRRDADRIVSAIWWKSGTGLPGSRTAMHP